MFNQQQRDKYIPELKGIVREQLVNEPGVLGFEKLGLKERPKSVGHGMKDWIDDSKHGVAKRLNAPIRADSRGHSKQVRDIVQPAPSMPWSLSDDQREFLRGATQHQIKFYQRITEGIYTSSGDNGQNIKASLHRMDRHNCGRISRKDFITVLRMVRSDLPKNHVQELAEKLDYYGDKTVDINKFISIFWKDQQKTPAGGKVHISTQHSMYKDQDDYHEYGVPSEPKTINRQQWLRELLKERSGGKRSTYKLVEKVLRHFKEATWKGQDQILYTLRAGDRRRTGAMREQEFRKAMKIIGLYLTEDEYIELFDLFDKDKSGDVTFDELVELLDEEHCGGAVNQPTVKNYTSNIDEPRDNRYSAARDDYDDRRNNQPRDNQRSARDGYDDRRNNQPRDNQRNARDGYDDRRNNQPRDNQRSARDDYDDRRNNQPINNQRSARDDYDDRRNGYRRNDQGTYQNYDEPPKNERYIQEQKRRELLRNNPSATYKAFRNLRQRLNEQFPIVDRSRLMRAMDLNRNGEIDRREFTQGLKNLGIHIPESEATALYKCLDSDRSGSVDMEEICILLDV